MSCSTLYGKAGLKDLDGDLKFLDSLGLFPEIYLPGDLLDSISKSQVESMLKWREEGKGLTFHAPFADLAPGGFDPKVREVTRLRFSQVMELAQRVEPGQIVFHPAFDEYRFAFREDLWIENSLGIWEELLEAADRANTGICLENVFDPQPGHLALLREKVGRELGFCLDTGHFLLFSRVPVDQWLDAFSDGLREVHLHDNDGLMDQHKPVGEGTFDFPSLYSQLRERDLEPVVVLEHHTRKETKRSLGNFQHSILES